MTPAVSDHKAERLADSVGATITRRDIAEALAISARTVDRFIAAGKLPPPDVRFSRKTHRWRLATLKPFFERGPAQTKSRK